METTRAILFRGKRIDNNEWVWGSYVRAHKYLGGPTGHFIYDIYGERRVLVAPDTVSEFTGLTDKNGTKIFEGDILNIQPYDGRVGTIIICGIGECLDMSGEKVFGVHGEPISGKGICRIIPLFCEDFYFEVIGNKWNNADLLESKNG